MPRMRQQDVLEGLAPVPTWNPGPVSPFGGIDVYDWRGSGDLLGFEEQGPTQRELDMLSVLGPAMNRRRFPPEMQVKVGMER